MGQYYYSTYNNPPPPKKKKILCKYQHKNTRKSSLSMPKIETEDQIYNLLDAYTNSTDKIDRAKLLEKINRELEISFYL